MRTRQRQPRVATRANPPLIRYVRKKMNNQEKINRLRELANAPDVTKGFSSQSACIKWVNEIGKFVNHNPYFYQVFSEQLDIIDTVGLRQGNLYSTAINKILTLINQVITDLEAGYPKPDKKIKTKKIDFENPEKVSLRWLWDHVPIRFWLYLVGVLFSVFLLGTKFASTNLYKSILP